MKLSLELKQQVIEACRERVSARVENANHAMQEAQLAANGEEKSSAGDKFETSRAMGHRDRDMYARQFVEAKNELQKMDRLSTDPSFLIRMGSLFLANGILYFIATGLGKIELNNLEIMVISKEAPIASAMLGKSKGDEFLWNSKSWKIEDLI